MIYHRNTVYIFIYMAGSGNGCSQCNPIFQSMVLTEPRMVFSIFLPGVTRANGPYDFQWILLTRRPRRVAIPGVYAGLGPKSGLMGYGFGYDYLT